MLSVILIAVALDLNDKPVENLTEIAVAELPRSGVENPVTAVLLNYRAYDTWLELGVLLLAMMGALALLRAGNLKQFVIAQSVDRTGFLARMMGLFLPLMLLVGGYLLWRGTHAPGGAFQAGALIAAAGVMARLAGRDRLHQVPGAVLRFVYALGFALFIVFGLWMVADKRAFLEFPPDVAGSWIFVLELFATLSIALALWSLYVAAYPDVDLTPGAIE